MWRAYEINFEISEGGRSDCGGGRASVGEDEDTNSYDDEGSKEWLVAGLAMPNGSLFWVVHFVFG